MSFKENILTSLGITDITPCSYRITLVGKKGVYIEGVKQLLDISPCQIVIDVKCKIIEINGCSLSVSSLNGGDIAILGEVYQILLKDKCV